MKKTLNEEINRFKSINKYISSNLYEQEAPLPPEPGDETTDNGELGTEEQPIDDNLGDLNEPTDGIEDNMNNEVADDTTEEINITDLVNMTRSIKKDIEDKFNNETQSQSQIVNVFSKLDELSEKLSAMDTIIQKIEQLNQKIEDVKPKTPEEKLEMRSLDSYPFNQRPVDFFNQKQAEMRATGKNEYILTKQDIDNYVPVDIKSSFDPNINGY